MYTDQLSQSEYLGPISLMTYLPCCVLKVGVAWGSFPPAAALDWLSGETAATARVPEPLALQNRSR